jgi:hypothetical protein
MVQTNFRLKMILMNKHYNLYSYQINYTVNQEQTELFIYIYTFYDILIYFE